MWSSVISRSRAATSRVLMATLNASTALRGSSEASAFSSFTRRTLRGRSASQGRVPQRRPTPEPPASRRTEAVATRQEQERPSHMRERRVGRGATVLLGDRLALASAARRVLKNPTSERRPKSQINPRRFEALRSSVATSLTPGNASRRERCAVARLFQGSSRPARPRPAASTPRATTARRACGSTRSRRRA